MVPGRGIAGLGVGVWLAAARGAGAGVEDNEAMLACWRVRLEQKNGAAEEATCSNNSC